MIVGSPTILNLVPGGVMKCVHVNQVNKNIEIQFKIMNGAAPYNLPEGVTCTIRGTKGDAFGYAAEAAVTAGSNVITVTLTEQLTAVAGAGNIFELVFVGAADDMKVSTENFILAVERQAMGEDTVISDSDLSYAEQVLDQLQSVGAVNAQVQQNKTNLAAEISRAQAAEAAEAAARQAADNTLQSNINAEASTRATQDASLQSQINQLVAPSGSAPSAAEVENARVGADGTVYPTLGDAIRTQNIQLKSQISDEQDITDKTTDITYSFTDYVAGSDGVTLIADTYYDQNGVAHSTASWSTILMRIPYDSMITVYAASTSKYAGIYSSQDLSANTIIKGWSTNTPFPTDAFRVSAGMYVAVSVQYSAAQIGTRAKISVATIADRVVKIKESALQNNILDAISDEQDITDKITDITYEYTDYVAGSDGVALIPDVYYDSAGNPHASTSNSTICMPITSDSMVKFYGASTTKYAGIYSASSLSPNTLVSGWDKNSFPRDAVRVSAGQYVVISVQYSAASIGTRAKFSVATIAGRTVKIKESALPDIDVDVPMAQIPTDALLYVDRLPTYYIEAASEPASFAEAQSYMDNKIASLPKSGKQFVFITDVHWAGNQKHSTDMIQYIRKCTGIRKVLFGGDIFGNANTKYLAAKTAAAYLNQSKRAFGRDYIPCVGDHDNNTVGASADAYLPDSVLVPMFVEALERTEDYHCYAPYAKLSTFATPGTDDFIGAMDFFKSVYYVDDTIDKVRYIVLNNGNGGNRGAMYNIFGTSGSDLLRLQFDWLAETLMSTPANYDVIVLSHKGPSGFSGTAGKALEVILAQFVQKNPSSYPHPSNTNTVVDQWWPNTTRYDFTNAPDIKRLICLIGHSHYDGLTKFGYTGGTFAYASSINSGDTIIQNPSEAMAQNVQVPVINTATDSSGAAESTSPSMTNGTVTEQCFDVITLTDTQIIMTRFGAGEDRVLNWGS